jgi:hypothetical protein
VMLLPIIYWFLGRADMGFQNGYLPLCWNGSTRNERKSIDVFLGFGYL